MISVRNQSALHNISIHEGRSIRYLCHIRGSRYLYRSSVVRTVRRQNYLFCLVMVRGGGMHSTYQEFGTDISLRNGNGVGVKIMQGL